MWGVLLGAAFVEFLPVASVHISKAQGVPDAIYGAALILIVLCSRPASRDCSSAQLLP
jgi:hypothetical protein